MSDEFDIYGDADPHNLPDGGAGRDTSAGDGLPGFPKEVDLSHSVHDLAVLALRSGLGLIGGAVSGVLGPETLGPAGAGALPWLAAPLAARKAARAGKAQRNANSLGADRAPHPGEDRVTNGLP